jgi:hypothetical protein
VIRRGAPNGSHGMKVLKAALLGAVSGVAWWGVFVALGRGTGGLPRPMRIENLMVKPGEWGYTFV